MVGTGPHPGSPLSVASKGMVYYLPKDVLVVTGVAHYVIEAGTVEIVETGEPRTAHPVDADGAADATDAVAFRVRRGLPVFDHAELDYTIETVADSDAFYRLEIKPGWLRADAHTLDLSPLGVMASVDTRAVGRAGEAARSVAAMAGNALGIGGRLGAEDSGLFPMAEDLRRRLPPTMPTRDQFYFSSHPEMLAMHDAVEDLAAERERLLQAQIAFATESPADAAGAVLRERIEAFRAAKLALEEELAAKSRQLLDSRSAFFREQGLAPTAVAKPFVRRFELSEIPPDQTYRDAATVIDVEDRLAADGFHRMRDCLAELNAYLTLDLHGASSPAGEAPERSEVHPGSAVYYRMPVPATVRLYSRRRDIRDQSMEGDRDVLLSNVRELALLHPDSHPTALPIVPSAWTERKSTITADTNLRPKRLSWESGAASGAAATSLEDAVAALRDESVRASSQMAAFRKNMREVRLGDLEDELAETRSRRLLLEEQIKLQGAVATEYQQVRLAELKVQADVLEEQLAIEKTLNKLEDEAR
jgi:hypothetical protein